MLQKVKTKREEDVAGKLITKEEQKGTNWTHTMIDQSWGLDEDDDNFEEGSNKDQEITWYG